MKLINIATIFTIILACVVCAPHAVAQSAETKKAEVSQTKVTPSKTSLININQATIDQLASLPGLGAKKAKAIIEYRELNGKFTDVRELVNVKGIGPKLLVKLAPLVNVKR